MRAGWLTNSRRSVSERGNTADGVRSAFDRMTIKLTTREFDEITSGARRHIHLPMTRHWARGLVGKKYKNLVLNRGLLTSMRIAIPWPGYSVELVRSGPMAAEVAVYSIDVSGAALPRSDAHADVGGPLEATASP
jgi:hypothetical protein